MKFWLQKNRGRAIGSFAPFALVQPKTRKDRKVRIADVGVHCSEGLLSRLTFGIELEETNIHDADGKARLA